MKRSGFTMIELIFVIVILGILAAVAIPRLAATRDDAKIAKGAQEVSTALTDMGAYYTANGELNVSTGTVTNVALDAASIAYGTAFYYEQPSGTDCVSYTVTSDGNITVAFPSSTDTVCQGIQTAGAASDLNKTHVFGGSRVRY